MGNGSVSKVLALFDLQNPHKNDKMPCTWNPPETGKQRQEETRASGQPVDLIDELQACEKLILQEVIEVPVCNTRLSSGLHTKVHTQKKSALPHFSYTPTCFLLLSHNLFCFVFCCCCCFRQSLQPTLVWNSCSPCLLQYVYLGEWWKGGQVDREGGRWRLGIQLAQCVQKPAFQQPQHPKIKL